MKKHVTNSSKQTQNLGFDIGKKIKNGTALALHGNLGSGKTTFVQGLAKGLGITKKIISPTFIIARKYEVGARSHLPAMQAHALQAGKSEVRNFYHIDLYRIENEEDLVGLGLEEILNDKSNIVAIEWPEKIENLLPKKRMNLYFDYSGNDARKIEIE